MWSALMFSFVKKRDVDIVPLSSGVRQALAHCIEVRKEWRGFMVKWFAIVIPSDFLGYHEWVI
jgi:hypothetical protein